MTAHQDPPRRSAPLAILRASHMLAAGLVAALPPAAAMPSVAWIALALWPYALSYRVAAAILARGRTGAIVQSTLTLLFTMPALDAYRGQLLGRMPTAALDGAVSVALAAVLLIASGHGVSAQRCVDGAGALGPQRRRVLALHAACGCFAVASLILRADLWPWRVAASPPASQWGAALITAALPFAASAIFSLNTTTMHAGRQRVWMTLLTGGAAVSAGYYGGLFGWPLQYWRDWAVLFALSTTFILAADWAGDEAPRYG